MKLISVDRIAKLFLHILSLTLALAVAVIAPCRSTFAEPESQLKSTSKKPEQVSLRAGARAPEQVQDVGVDEHLGETLHIDGLSFLDSSGQSVDLKTLLMGGKPTIFAFVYYECPMLCTMVLNGLVQGMRGLDWSLGQQFQVVVLSIDPRDTPAVGAPKKANYLNSYLEGSGRDRSLVEKNWHFLTGDQASIARIAEQIGFKFKYDGMEEEYAHPGVIFAITPEMKISRYLYGIQYRPRDLRLALLEASQGKVGNVFDRFLMFCYHYEPSKRGYAVHAVRVMQLGGMLTLLILGSFLWILFKRERVKR